MRKRFNYNCAQNETRQHKLKKHQREDVPKRDKAQMDSFACHGWCYVTVRDDSDVVLVKLKHEEYHVPYWKVDIPDDIQEYIRAHSDLAMGEVQLHD